MTIQAVAPRRPRAAAPVPPAAQSRETTGGLYRKERFLRRHPANPILSPLDFPDVDAVFNCGQTMFEGKTLLLLSVCPRDGLPWMHVATSGDGVHFDLAPEPFIEGGDLLWPGADNWPIDPRVTAMADGYYITRPVSGPGGVACVLERTRDWKTRETLGCVALPNNRVPCLFPEKVGGLYCRIDRPGGLEEGSLWLSRSPDLLHWGGHQPLAGVPYSPVWSAVKVGPTPPVRTRAGWLMVYHGVLTYAGGGRYSLGAMLLDADDPARVIGHSHGWILTPDAPYEFMGNCQNCVFACGALVDEDADRIRVYYGAADTCVGLAEGGLSALLDECLAPARRGTVKSV